jgi:low temperature requirement protein LtrA
VINVDTVAIVMRSAITTVLLMSIYFIIEVYFRHRKAYRIAPRAVGLIPHTYTILMCAGVFLLEFGLGWALGQQLRAGTGVSEPAALWRYGLFLVGSFCILAGLMIVRRTEKRRVVLAKVEAKIVKDLDRKDDERQGH